MSDPTPTAENELFAPPPVTTAKMPSPDAGTPTSLTYEQALANGTIPTFDDQPHDAIPTDPTPPVDPEAEWHALEQFLALVNECAGAGTRVSVISRDDFLKGL